MNDQGAAKTPCQLDVATSMHGIVGSIELTPTQSAQLTPRAVELETLVTQLRAFAATDDASARAIGAQFGPKARAALSDQSFPNLSLDTPQSANTVG